MYDNFKMLEGYWGSTGAAFKAVASKGLSDFISSGTGRVIAIVGTYYAMSKALQAVSDAYNLSYDSAIKNTKASVDAYKSTKSELEELKSQAEEYKSTLLSLGEKYEINLDGLDSIDELLFKLKTSEKLELVEQAEIDKIQSANDSLERQEKIKERLSLSQQKDAASNAKDALNRGTQSVAQQAAQYVPGGRKTYQGLVENVNIATAVKEDIRDIQKYEDEIAKLEKSMENLDPKSKGWKQAEKDIKDYEHAIVKLTSDLDSKEEDLSNLLSALSVNGEGLESLKGYEKYFKEVQSAFEDINNFDLSPAEKHLSQIESFFNGSKISNSLKNTIKQMLETNEVENATDALHKMGVTLNDLGITGKGNKKAFDNYFQGLIDSAQEAQNVINSIDGSVDGVKFAFESENKDANWNSMAEYLKQAEEMYAKTGKIGTDDFKSAVQFISPEIINPDAEGFKYDADAYVAAWENAREKVKRYFDSENPIDSTTNFTNDIIDKGLASKVNDDITWNFKTSAEAASALGISIEAAEVAMHNLESYGAEFDDVMFSGEGLKRYQSALEQIKEIYDEMDHGSAGKERLKNIIDQSELDDFENNLNNLTEDQVIKIEFEYDLATVQQQINELKQGMLDSGGSTEEYAALISNQRKRRDMLAEQGGMSGSIDDEGYKKSLSAFDGLSQKLMSQYNSLGEEGRRSIQQQQSALLDLQNTFLDLFSGGSVADWESFFNTDEANIIIEKLASDTGKNIETVKNELTELMNSEIEDTTIDINANDNASDVIISVLSELMGLPKEKISELIANDNASDVVINYLSSLSGIPAETLTSINATDGASGVITYVLSQILGIPEERVSNLLASDNASDIASMVTSSIKNIPKTHNSKLTATDNASSKARTASDAVKSIPKTRHVSITGSISGVFSSAVAKAKAMLSSLSGGGAAKLYGTAHFNGTSTNYLQRFSGSAFASGTLEDDSWLKPQWKTKKNQFALTGEVGPELVVHGNEWWTVGDNGAEFNAIPSNSIIFNARQTKELLSKGFTNSRGTAYLSGTAYANGWRLPSAVSNSSGSSKKNSSNKNSSASSNTADAISDTNEKAKEFEETLDSIEILIDRIERQIKNLERVAGSAFNTFEKRNSTLRQQMSSITQEIAIQQQGYDRYLQEANSVGLSEEYKNLVMNGAIDISTITDETLSKNIQEFKQWYEKALNCRDAVEELKESVRELYKEAFDNVVTLYDGMLSQIEHRRNMLEGYIDQTEAQGYIVSTKYYNALISNEQNNLSKLTKERNDLINAMNDAIANGGIEMYSEQWYDFQQEINSVNEAIQDANTSIIEFKNSIREIEWGIFDKIQDRISGITDEADFLVKVMSDEKMYDDKGVVTKHGTATYGLHGVNYNVYMSQADQYKKEMKSIEMELSKDPYNQTLIERRKELLELQQESILAAEDEKQAIKSLVEEGIQKQLDALKELIDKYNDALDSQKDMYDYQKNIDKQQKKVNSLEKQWIAYQGDDSEEGSVKRQQTWNDLEEARAELEETQYEKYISDQKKLLDELYTEYETVLNMRLDNLDQLIASVIEGVNAEGSNIRDTLISESEKVGYTLTNSMETIWGASGTIASILTTYSSNFSSIMTSVQEAINAIKIAIQNAISASNKNASDNISKIDRDQAQQTARPTISNTPSTSINTNTNNNGGDGVPRIGDKVTYVKDRYYASSSGANPSGYQMLGQSVYITSINNASWAKKPYHISRGPTLGNGDLGWVTLDQLQGYRTGKPIIDKNQLAWTQENGDELVLGRSDGAILTPLKRGDAVVNKKGTDQVVEFARNPKAFVGKSLSELTQEMPIMKNEGVGNMVQNDIHMSIGIDHVEGYNDFVTQLQKDHQFEKFIQTITTDRIMGKGSLGKYNVKFR